MRFVTIFLSIFFLAFIPSQKSIYDYTVKDIDGRDFSFSTLKGKRFMVVNVASKCKNTPQYEQLEALYRKYKDSGFEIIAFPANNFLWQEPGSNEKIKDFCTSNYQVSFRMMSKISVKGKDMAPIYHWLTEKELNGFKDSKVKWNFQKYLISKEGKLIAIIPPGTKPDIPSVIHWIETGEYKE